MIKRVPFKARKCASCGQLFGAAEFVVSSSVFFPDGHLTVCNECLDNMCLDLHGEWAFVDSVCRWADVSFIPEKWTALWSSAPDKALSSYLRMMGRAEYSKIKWDTYQEKWEQVIAQHRENELHPAFDAENIKEMTHNWGSSYSQDELYHLEELFQGVKKSFGISNPLNEQDGRQLCKLSLAIDQCIAEGANGVDKLVNSYNKLKEGAGFTNDNAADANNFDTISELAYYFEETGWKTKFHNDEVKDVVDASIKNMQNYNSRLYKNEASIGDQIEERLENMKRVATLENMSFSDDELDKFNSEGYAEDEEQEFEVEI